MKKVFSMLAMVVMMVTLTACMDDPDGGNKKPTNYGSGAEQQKG